MLDVEKRLLEMNQLIRWSGLNYHGSKVHRFFCEKRADNKNGVRTSRICYKALGQLHFIHTLY
jgi:hypothetical protein